MTEAGYRIRQRPEDGRWVVTFNGQYRGDFPTLASAISWIEGRAADAWNRSTT